MRPIIRENGTVTGITGFPRTFCEYGKYYEYYFRALFRRRREIPDFVLASGSAVRVIPCRGFGSRDFSDRTHKPHRPHEVRSKTAQPILIAEN